MAARATANVVVDYTVGGTATADVDYTDDMGGSLTIDTPGTTGTIVIPTKAVEGDGAGETMVVMLNNAATENGTATLATPRAVTTTFAPQDTVIVSVAAPENFAENGSGIFTVSLTGGAHTSGLMVNYTVGGDASADDYDEAASGTLTFLAADDRSKQITLTADDDDREEGDETVTVTLSLSGQASNVSLGTPSAAAKITDNDSLSATVVNARANEDDGGDVNEGGDATFMVTLTTGVTSTADVVVEYQVGGDVTSADYTAPSGMLTIPAGSSSGIITITTIDDTGRETSEALTVTLTDAETAGRAVEIDETNGNNMATATIVASDGEILLSVSDARTVNEGEEAVFAVALNGTLDDDLVVTYSTVQDTATEADDDYDEVSDVALTIKAGRRSATIKVSTNMDTSAENDEKFKVMLNESHENVGIGDGEGEATIRDDDPLRVNLSGPKSVTVGGTLTYTLQLTGGTGSADIVVSYQAGTFTGSHTIDADLRSDTFDGPSTSGRAGETIVMRITNVAPGAGRVTPGTSSVSTSITSSDTVTVSVSVPSTAPEEGADAVFTVSSTSGTFTGDIVVNYSTATGTAGSSDFKRASGTRTISASDTDTVTVETEEDTRAENDETFSLSISLVSPRDGSVVLGVDRATATIEDDETLAASVRPLQTTVLEGSDARFEVALASDGASASGSSAVVVSYTVVASEATTADYTEPSGKLTIPAGQSKGTIVVSTKVDNVLESDTALGLAAETIAVRLDSADTTAANNPTAAGTSAPPTTIRDSDGTVVVSVADAAPVTEGQAAVFTVSLSGKVSQPVTVTAVTTPSAGTDFDAPQPTTLSIEAGDTTGRFTVQTTDDASDPRAEADETFTLTIDVATPPPGVVLGKNTATGTIRDNDPLRVNISGPSAVSSAATNAEFTVNLTGGKGSETITIDYTYTVGSTSGSGSVDIATTADSATITVPNTNNAFEARQTLAVTLTDVSTTLADGSSAGRVTVGTSRASARIAGFVISAGDQERPEGTDLSFSVSSDGNPPADPVVVRASTSPGTARANADYTTQSRTFTLSGSEMVDVPTLSDTLNEGDETLTLRLFLVSALSGVLVGTPTVTGTITDDGDNISATVVPGQTTVTEGDPATFIVSLTGGTSTAAVVIDYTVGGTATPEDGDFTAPSGKLSIPAGATSGTISIPVLDDGALDRGETLTVTLTGGTSAGTVDPPNNTATTMIADASDGVTVSVVDTTVDEGETAMLMVELSGGVDDDVTVDFEVTAGTATAGAGNDFEVPSATSVTIEKGETTEMIPVKTLDDMLAEATETFTVTITLPEGTPDGVTVGDASASVMITDDALTATVVGPTEVEEGSEAEYTVTLTGGGGEAEDVTVTFSTGDSTATAGVDFAPASGSVTIPADEGMATFTIQILEDEEADLGETLVLSVEGETADGDTVRVIPPAPATIVDDDGSVDVSIMAEQPVVPEGQSASFIVELSGTVSNADVTLQYTVGGAPGDTATAEDFTAAADPTITIPAGQMSFTISVAATRDDQDEPDERLSVVLQQGDALPEGVAIGTETATVTITDYVLTASVTGPASVTEGESATFTVELTGVDDNRSDALVRYTWTAGTAQAPGDFDAPSGTLTIPEGQTSGTITIVTKDDGVLDSGETLILTLTDETSALGTGLVVVDSTADAASTMVVDGGSVTWSVADITVDEGDPAIFTVTLSDLVQDDVTLTYLTQDDSADAGDDYTGESSGQVTVRGNSLSASFTVATLQDRDPESTETFTVRLTLAANAPDGVTPGSSQAMASITDDDLALVPVPDVTMTEGQTRTITLAFDPAPSDAVMLSVVASGTATAGTDYVVAVGGTPLGLQPTFPLPANTPAVPVEFRALEDSLAEGTETVTAVLWTVLPSGQQGSRIGSVTVTIEDNDELSASVTVPETVTEGETAPFTVTLSGGTSTANVVVSYTVGGTAKAPGDYAAPSESLTIQSGESSGTISIQTNTDNEIEPDETLVVTLTDAQTANGTAGVGSPRSATTAIQDPVFHSFNRVNQTLLPGVVRASAASALEAVSWRMVEAAQGDPPAASADLAGLTGLYRALLANERALQDGSYDLAKVLGGSSFLVPLSSHDGDAGSEVGIAVWGGGDFRTIGGGAADTVDWDGSVWSARLGADMRFVDSLLTGIAVSWASGALDYVDATPRDARVGTYATWLVNVHPYVGWTTPDFGLWASGGFGFGGVTLDDSEEDAQEADLTQWSVGAGGSVTLLSTDWFIAGGTTAVKLKAEGFLAGATVAENESKVIQELTVGVNQARAAIEASHAQHFAGGGSLRPSLEIGGRFDGGDGETGAGLEVGGGLTYADPGSGLTVAGTGRALVIRDGNYGEWGLSGLIQLDPNAAGHGLMMSVRPTFGVTASGVSGLWEHGTLDLLSGGEAAGGRVEAEIGYGLAAFGTAGVLTPYAGASLTDAGAHSLSLGGRLELGPAFDLTLELERSDSADPDTAAEHDITLEGSFSW